MSTQDILVVGATGKQGSAFIRSAVAANNEFRILALTRNASSPAAKALASLSERVQIVQANLDVPDSVRKVFQDAAQGDGNIWGVLLVLAFPGLGADATGEEKQGILVADLAHEFKIKHFIFSSFERGGQSSDDEYTLNRTRAAKINIERHIRSLEGLPWTFLRPGFFMENFDGSIGTITSTVLRCGLKPETKVQLIAADDIGHIARAVFEAPDQHVSNAISVIGDVLTSREWNEAYQRGSGNPLPGVPAFVAKGLLAINSHVKALIVDMERVHNVRSAMEGDESYESRLAQCRALYPGMLTFEEWARKKGRKNTREKNWNNVSLLDLVRGKR